MMKLYLITITQPGKRSVSTKRGVVMCESSEKAIEIAKNFYPPACQGWAKDTTFEAVNLFAEKLHFI
jgi:hypothetical protein